jgi:hypothetical protein
MTARSEAVLREAAQACVDRLGSQRVVHRGRGEEWICEVSRAQLLALAAALALPREEGRCDPECSYCREWRAEQASPPPPQPTERSET